MRLAKIIALLSYTANFAKTAPAVERFRSRRIAWQLPATADPLLSGWAL